MAYVAYSDNGDPDELFWDFVEEYVIFRRFSYSKLDEIVWELYTHPAEIWDCYREHRVRCDYRNPFWIGKTHFLYGINVLTPEEHYIRMFVSRDYLPFFGVKAQNIKIPSYKPCCDKHKNQRVVSRWWNRAFSPRRPLVRVGQDGLPRYWRENPGIKERLQSA